MRVREAALLVLVSLLGLTLIGPALIGRFGLYGVIAAEVLLVGLPAFAALALRMEPGPPAERGAVLGGVLVGAGAFWILGLVQSFVFERWLPPPPELQEEVERLVGVDADAPRLLLDFLALALAPAVCEEALFRGVVLRSLLGRAASRGTPSPSAQGRSRFSPPLSVTIAAVTFGAFHLSYYKFIPVTLMGMVLGLVCWRARSLAAAVAAHASNNLCVIALVRLGRDRPLGLGSGAGLGALALAIVAVVSGIALLRRRDPGSAQLS